MPTQASKDRRSARHAAEKAAKKAARALPVLTPTKQELEAGTQMERVRNMPRGSWLNGRLSKNSYAPRATRPGESILHELAEGENHDRSVAQKHTVEYHTTDPDAALPPNSGETLKVVHPRYEDENGKTWLYNEATSEWDIPFVQE